MFPQGNASFYQFYRYWRPKKGMNQKLRDRLCGLVIRIPGSRSRGSDFDSWGYQIFREVLALEQGPPSLMSTTEELLGRGK
jgi:hypothetical protein